MPIQPLVLFTSTPEEHQVIQAGQVFSFRFELSEATPIVDLAVVQAPVGQHFSLCCWVSAVPNSVSLGFPHPATQSWHPAQKLAHVVRCQTAPLDDLRVIGPYTYPLVLPNGVYWLNVENLPNSQNAFYIRLTSPV